MSDEDHWFVEQSLGRIGVADWRGLLCILALGVLLFVGMGVEGACRPDHPVLEAVLMVPLGAAVLSLGWIMTSRTRRRGDRRRKDGNS